MNDPTRQTARVLLIEDDEGDALLVERLLERYPQFKLRHVPRLWPAIELASTEPFDVALVDLSLPDSYGLEGLTTLRTHVPELPIVVLTGNDDDRLPLEALERGAQDYLCKSHCSPEMLSRSLRYSMQRHHIQCENRQLLKELARQARYDGLTGVLNRPTLVAELEREARRAKRTGYPLSCVMIDIDYFKRINDSYGHSAGDTVLRQMANLLKQRCRSSDLPGRYGGEEFLVVLPQTNEEGALAWAERLRQSISGMQMDVAEHFVQVTASFGVATLSPEEDNSEAIVEQADQALRLAKQLGRDQTVPFRATLAASESVDATQDAFGSLKAADIMTPLVATLTETATVHDATDFLLNLRVESAPIVDAEGKLLGLISEEKLGDILASTDAWCRPITEVMRRKPFCFSTDAPVTAIQDFLARAADRRVIIVTEEQPVGLVSRANILRWRELHGTSMRARLEELARGANRCEDDLNLSVLCTEIQNQATHLCDQLEYSNDDENSLLVSAATRIHTLLERAIACSQRRRALDKESTIVELAS